MRKRVSSNICNRLSVAGPTGGALPCNLYLFKNLPRIRRHASAPYCSTSKVSARTSSHQIYAGSIWVKAHNLYAGLPPLIFKCERARACTVSANPTDEEQQRRRPKTRESKTKHAAGANLTSQHRYIHTRAYIFDDVLFIRGANAHTLTHTNCDSNNTHSFTYPHI